MTLRALALAFGLLTRLPLPRRCFASEVEIEDQQNSVLWYPFVGAILAGLLLLAVWALPNHLSVYTQAALLVSLWVGLTGALHLDGLADCTDAFFGAHKDPQRALAIMKDPSIGPMAVVVLVCSLLLKTVLVAELYIQNTIVAGMLVALVAPRALLMVYLLTTPYARSEGLAANLNPSANAHWVFSILIALLGLGLLMLPFAFWLTALLGLALLMWWWRALWLKLIGGYTGDCLGALVELAELLCLLAAALSLWH